jgi:ABC-2 type transport system permease protein
MIPILRRWLVDGWRGTAGWCAGMIVVMAVYLPLFPSMQTPELAGMLDSLPPELVRTLGYDDITSGAGYTQATFFGLVGFALMAVAAVSWGGSVIAGAEESGRLELTVAHGVGRVQYALESAAAVLVRVLVVGAVVLATLLVLNEPSQLDLEVGRIVAEVAAWTGLGFLFAAVALAAGAITGARSWAIGAGAGVAAASFVVQAVANNSEDLADLERFSPFFWAYGQSPLANGFDAPGLALLWGFALAFVAVATFALRRRDILG